MNTTVSNNSDKDPSSKHYLIWFRRDLRIHDNTAFANICKEANQQNGQCSAKISALFFITPEQWLEHNMAISQVDLILRTLPKLAKLLHRQFNIQLDVQVSNKYSQCEQHLIAYCEKNQITDISANHEYELNEQLRDQNISQMASKLGITFDLYHDQCIVEPLTLLTQDEKMYQVFTPFYKRWKNQLETSPIQLNHAMPITAPSTAQDTSLISASLINNPLVNGSLDIDVPYPEVLATYKQLWLSKLPAEIAQTQQSQVTDLLIQSRIDFPAGEIEACHRLDEFICGDIRQYDIARDTPKLDATSHLSPYLAIGSISPRLCYLQAMKAVYATINQTKTGSHLVTNQALEASNNQLAFEKPSTTPLEPIQDHSTDIMRWISELCWRDFYRHVLVNKPLLIKHQAYHIDTDAKINWSYNQADFACWCAGTTGFPIVDAAMTCLNATGYMHNRLRMVVAMFLTKDLLIDWRLGERYFMQMLIDGDFASNNGGWQWSASTGTDAAPYFRIMNPFSQSKTHDTDAIFIKTWLPELRLVDARILHDELKLTKFLQDNSYVKYPKPMVNHKQARLHAIEQFKVKVD